jgi:hypothetical protein
MSDHLAFSRHRRLATAVPFPELDWGADRDNCLKILYHHAQELAESGMDWYNTDKVKKRRLVYTLRWVTIVFAVVGALLPFSRIFAPYLGLGNWIAPANSELTLQLSLVLLGIAAAFNFADKLLGASSGWKRSEMTSLRLSELLTVFCLTWNELEFRESLPGQGGRHQPPNDGSGTNSAPPAVSLPDDQSSEPVQEKTRSGQAPPPSPPNKMDSLAAQPPRTPASTAPAPVLTLPEQKYALIRDFCIGVLDIVKEETSSWAEEFAQSASQSHEELTSVFSRSRTPGK